MAERPAHGDLSVPVKSAAMAAYALLHGAGSSSWYWHLVAPQLEAAGHEVVAPDLPCDDDSAGLDEYAEAVVEAVGERGEVIVVAQSLAGFSAPLVCERCPVALLVLLNAMVPRPGESAGQWWVNTGHMFPDPFDPEDVFLHDVGPEVAAQAIHHVRRQSDAIFVQPWPLRSWPSVPTRTLVCRGDRLFPLDFQRRVVRERLGITPDEMEGGHLPALARPHELVERLEAYRMAL
jgi:pimeloyl-ACP methyl ester carboxylesterase